jgi:Holliday junction resolvase
MAARTDSNQKTIVAALRQAGFSVCILSAAGHGGVAGCPDLVCGGSGTNWLMEVKAPGGKLTPDQVKWYAAWRGQVAVVRSVDDALRVVGVLPQQG